MRRPRAVRAAASLIVLIAILIGVLFGCIDHPPRRGPRLPPPPTETDRSGAPQAPTPPASDSALAESRFRVGPAEIVVGPEKYVDSYFTAIKVGDTVRGYVGNRHTFLLEGTSVADVVATDRRVIEAGRDATVWDDCGAWLEGVEPDVKQPRVLRAWYHAEWRCNYAIDQTDKSIAYAESRDGGRTFVKVGYPDNQVVTSSLPFVEHQRNGRGDFTVIRRDGFYYLYYLAVLADEKTVTSVARAPVGSGGVPGSWRNYTVDEGGRGRWTEDARDGAAAALETSPPVASASVHRSSGEVVLARQHPKSGGIVLQTSTDGLHFTRLPEPLVPFLESQTRDGWGTSSEEQIVGYVSVVGPDGSRSWADEFYLFHLYVFPGDELFGNRYLVRRKVVVEHAPPEGPWSTVALSSYVGPGGDRFATSAPERSGTTDGVVGYLLGAPRDGRRRLFECASADGSDRFVSAECGEAPRKERMVGYAFTDEQPDTVALYRCEVDGDQFVSLDEGCDGGRTIAELGWVYP
jgi:hypothetical protein